MNYPSVALVSLILSLGNSFLVEDLAEAIDNIENSIRSRNMLPTDVNVIHYSDLVRMVSDSGLHPDAIKFIMDFINLHLANLPTQEEIQNLINVMKKLESKLAMDDYNIANYITKHMKGPNGPGPDAGASRSTGIPS